MVDKLPNQQISPLKIYLSPIPTYLLLPLTFPSLFICYLSIYISIGLSRYRAGAYTILYVPPSPVNICLLDQAPPQTPFPARSRRRSVSCLACRPGQPVIHLFYNSCDSCFRASQSFASNFSHVAPVKRHSTPTENPLLSAVLYPYTCIAAISPVHYSSARRYCTFARWLVLRCNAVTTACNVGARAIPTAVTDISKRLTSPHISVPAPCTV